jgi:thioesterase domain-containing protein
LRAYLRERLPEYMRPAFYVRLDHLPLTANGKVDRHALPAPDAVTRVEGGGIVWPGNPTENQLVRIWEDLLNVRPIGVTDNFFEIGGHSLLAVRMMHEVERTCGRRLPLLTLFEGATIRQLGRALLGRTAESPAAALTAIHSGGSRRPFFFLHGDFNGGGFYSVALARELGPEQPFYALHPHGLDGRPMRRSIEEMADDHLATLRAVQPNGPYVLGGHCNGGLIALDMARRLRAEGERVDLVAVLDTWVQAPGSRPPAWDEDSAHQAATPLGEAYQRAISAYVPERFPAPVALFYSGTEPDTEFEVTWQAVAEDLRVFRIPGNHLDFITRDVHILGALLRSCLEAGDTRPLS